MKPAIVENRALSGHPPAFPVGHDSLAPPCGASAVITFLLILQLCTANNCVAVGCMYPPVEQVLICGYSQHCCLCPASPVNLDTHAHAPRSYYTYVVSFGKLPSLSQQPEHFKFSPTT